MEEKEARGELDPEVWAFLDGLAELIAEDVLRRDNDAGREPGAEPEREGS